MLYIYDATRYRVQVAELASLAQLLPPRSPTVRNPAPDSSLCRAAPRLRPLQLLLAACVASAAAPGPDCGIRFNCCSPFASASSCYSPIASASTAAPRLRLLDSSPCLVWRSQTLAPSGCARLAHAMPGPNVVEHSSRSSRFSK